MDITVLILAAGKCTRFWPLRNKNSTSFLGKPLILHQVEKLKLSGFNDILVTVNKENDKEIKSLGLNCVLQEGDGQGSAILAAEKEITGPLLIMNGDDVFDLDLLKKTKQYLEKEKPEGLLTAVEVKEYFPGGYLKVENDVVKEIIEKPGKDKMPSNLFRLVLDYYRDSQKLFDSIKKIAQGSNQYEDVLNLLIEGGLNFKCQRYDGKWGSLKYPWHTLDVMNLFLAEIKESKISPSAKIAETAIIQGPVIIEDGVKIYEHAKIVGPCCLGKNVIIGNNVILRGSEIGEGSVLGFSTDIARSYIGKNCWFHSNYAGDSVLGNNVSMGAGANLANLRLDDEDISSDIKGEKVSAQRNKLGAIIGNNVRIGVNASVMPGVKIGGGSFIGSGVLLEKDVPDNKFVYMKTELVIKDNISQVSEGREEFRDKLK